LSSFEIIAFYFAHPFDILGAGSLRYGGKGQIFYGLSRVKYVTNLYSVLLIEVGIFAVLFYILFIYKVFKLTHRNINRNDERRRYFLVGLYVLGIYTLNTLALQVMLDPIYLLLILLPFTIREKLNRAYAAPSSDLFVARAAGI
jgi:succinate-acetate transporter protein